MPVWAYLVAAVAGYLLGSIPTGYLVGRARGIDIRQLGSGNIGATNVFRILGKPAGIGVLLVDVLKGLGAVVGVVALAASFAATSSGTVGPEGAGGGREHLGMVAGVAAILGHNYTCWLGFKGGKGIATSAGVLLALMPAALGVCLAVWLIVFASTRYVSLASIAAAVALPFAVWITRGGALLTGIGLVLGVLAIYKHRVNLRRLRDGTEHRFGRSKTLAPSNPA